MSGFLLTRRELLAAAATVPVLPLRGAQGPEQPTTVRQPPYAALEKFIEPGHDEFPEEKAAFQIRAHLQEAFGTRELPLPAGAIGSSPCPHEYRRLASDLREAVYDRSDKEIASGWRRWIESLGKVMRIQFFVLPEEQIRFEVASDRGYRVGLWKQRWVNGQLLEFSPVEEHWATATRPWFRDRTAAAFRNAPELQQQFTHGIPYWRAALDPASGIDVYGSNGIAVGDIDGDGMDEVYVCQPGGLPNRLLKYQPDGTFTDISKAWGVDLLDDTSCALFLDLRNSGRQDLVVLRASGPLLFVNEDSHCSLRRDAFRFATVPKGGFTGMAAADFDRDGKLDLYLCCYVYFQSEAQYTYASPYHDAQNGPPNFLFRNRLQGDGTGAFEDCTAETGMMENNNRFSFAPAWCDYDGDGWPDLYVANDFGRKNLYKNEGEHFRDVAGKAGVEDIGPGMSASWFDYDGDGKPDLYVANMWTDAGQRVIHDKQFKPAQKSAEAYHAHTMGNTLFRNRGNGAFEDTTMAQHVSFGRWAWGSGGHDFDNDGNPEIFVTCGMLTNESTTDLNSFFWRQVVAKSPVTAQPSSAYENGWNAINQFLREDFSWNGREPNVLHVRRGDRYFDFSGVSGLDFADDSRAFAVADFDGDGRPDLVLKSRLGPQVRVLQNQCAGNNHAVAFRLRGTKSNRDAIGARIEVDGQTKWLEAGSGFLSQHSKRLIFGLGSRDTVKVVKVTWPSGTVQQFRNLEAGGTYSLVEESAEAHREPFAQRGAESAGAAVAADNAMALHDTWFLEPVPLPSKQPGPGLFVIQEVTPEYEVFRRYLFDWRTALVPPLALLLNAQGEAVKVYAAIPSAQQVREDLAAKPNPLPFDGFYLKAPKRDFFKFGAAYLWAGMPEQALPYLKRVLVQSPQNPRVLVLVGQIHFQAGRWDEANQYFQKAADVNGMSVAAWIGLGDVADKKNDSKAAADYYARALKIEPGSAEAANGLGLALAKQGELERAKPLFEQAIAARRDYSEAINNLGVLYLQQGKVNDAIAALQYGIGVAPEEDILYLNLGRIYVQAGQPDKARQIMQELLDRKPGDATARHALDQLGAR